MSTKPYIAQIQARYTRAELCRIFTARLDDEMFLRAGRRVLKGRVTGSNRHIYILGYEYLVGSPRLGD